MRIRDVYSEGSLGLSFEIFPPKTPAGDKVLARTLADLARYQPGFISCTYGAGGSTQENTFRWCQRIQQEYSQTATAHFTCVGSTKSELLNWLSNAYEAGIHNIMALRGDPPEGSETFVPADGGLSHANELVELIREKFPEMGIGVAGYPEKHPEAPNADEDLQNLKRKVDAGADAIFTQLFYDNASFFQFRERCDKAGIKVPIVPGIMPVTEFARIKRITSLCGAKIPDEFGQRLEAVQDDKVAQFEAGIDFATHQCQELLEQGIPGIHFYVLNKSEACGRIMESLGFGSPAPE